MNDTAGIADPSTWNRFVEKQGGHLLQTSAWGLFKSAFGWEHEIVMIDGPQGLISGGLVLFRRLPLRLGMIAYVPRGPVVNWDDERAVRSLFSALDLVARDRRAALLKVEPDVEDSSRMRDQLEALNFRPSPQTVQPPRSTMLDVTGTEDDILGRMNQGTRRKIHTAHKRQVMVRRGTPDDLDSFNDLTQVTGERDGFGVHSPAYFSKVFELFAPDQAVLLVASYGDHDLAGLMAFRLGKRAWYLYGASSNEERDRMPNYALQWEAIRWAREHGCTVYDLWGIPDEDAVTLEAHFQDRNDGLWGVYGFKRGFGGRNWRSVGAWDRVYNPAIYTAYRLAARHRE